MLYPTTSRTATTTPSPTAPHPHRRHRALSSSSATASPHLSSTGNDDNIDVKGKAILCIVGDPPPPICSSSVATPSPTTAADLQVRTSRAWGRRRPHPPHRLSKLRLGRRQNSNTSEKPLRDNKDLQLKPKLDPARRAKQIFKSSNPTPTPRSPPQANPASKQSNSPSVSTPTSKA